MDPEFRPETYFRPQRLDRYRVSRVKGTVVRNNLQALMDAGQDEALNELLDSEACSPEGLQALEAVHPMFMGGNYLPNLRVGEVEIARISIESTTGDVTAVYARKAGGRIQYRVVDEYEGQTLDEQVRVTSMKPLSLRALVDYFLRAWPLTEVLDSNFEGDCRGAMHFFTGSSAFYPEFDALCRERVLAHFAETQGDAEEPSD